LDTLGCPQLLIEAHDLINLPLPGEGMLDTLSPAEPHLPRLVCATQESADRMRQGRIGLRIDEQAGLAVEDDVLQGAGAYCHDGFPNRHGLQRRPAGAL
jgi:hypothetical protein